MCPSLLSQLERFHPFFYGICTHNEILLTIIHNFFIHSSFDGHLISWLLQIMLQWIWGCISLFKIMFFFSFDKYPKVELLGNVVVFLIFGGISILFFRVAAPIYIPNNSAQASLFLHISEFQLKFWKLLLKIVILTNLLQKSFGAYN